MMPRWYALRIDEFAQPVAYRNTCIYGGKFRGVAQPLGKPVRAVGVKVVGDDGEGLSFNEGAAVR